MTGLEIIKRRPRGKAHGPKLLFVHGISVGGWVWEEHFLPFFAEAGFESYAISLRGHGNSKGHENLANYTLRDYTEDLSEAANSIGGPLVVIGHSLGGAVVQHWLQQGGEAVGTALLASVPPWGLAVSSMRMALTNPRLYHALAVSSTSGIDAADATVLRQGLFSPDVSKKAYADFMARAQDESMLVGLELNGLTSFAPTPGKRPMFVLGAADDKLIPVDEVWRTAAYYGTSPTIAPNLAHAVMLDTYWKNAATPLLQWIETL